MRVEKIGEEYCLRLTAQMVHALQIEEGAEVDVQPVRTIGAVSSRIDADEALHSYLQTEAQYADVYRELAK